MKIPDLPEMHMDLPKLYGKHGDGGRKYGSEMEFCRERLLKYCEGCGLDLGCGTKKIRSEALGMDIRAYHRPIQILGNIWDLSIFWTDSFDYVFSSHALEEAEDTEAVLTEWLRVIKPEGYLILYCPDPQYYFNIGHKRANSQHKHDYYWWDVARIIDKIKPSCELIHYHRSGPVSITEEWSWDLVVQKKEADHEPK